MGIGFVIFLLLWGFVVGGLARFAVPGPDPMPWWATVALGLGGSIVGGVVGKLFFGYSGGFPLAFAAAVLLLILYRRYVQHRPITGPRAHEPPR